MSNGAVSLQKTYSFKKDEFEKTLELFLSLQEDISSARELPDKTKSLLYEKFREMVLYSEPAVNDLDVFWSFIARAEIAFKIYDKNSTPDSLKELTMIIWKVQCRVEGRPLNAVPPILF